MYNNVTITNNDKRSNLTHEIKRSPSGNIIFVDATDIADLNDIRMISLAALHRIFVNFGSNVLFNLQSERLKEKKIEE